MMMNKKATTEIISFVLITLLIVVASSLTYIFSSNYLETKVSELDSNKMENSLKEISYMTDKIQKIDRSMSSIIISFSSGLFIIEDNKYLYSSFVKTEGNYCSDILCYYSNNGFLNMFYNLSNSYTFENNLSLNPGSYIISFENIKNESKIKLSVKKQ